MRMRIIAGLGKGRKLFSPPDITRPTSDRAREGLFSTLISKFGTLSGIKFLDLFAGSGAVGIEALSRGVSLVEAVESNPESAKVCLQNFELISNLEGMGDFKLHTNTDRGYSYAITAKIEKPAVNGLGGMIGYTNAKSTDLQSVGSTVQANAPSVGGQNFLAPSFTDNDLRHRFIGYVNYRINYGGKFGGSTELTLGATSASGSKISYIYGNDLNGDGQINDLIYVPNNATEITFATLTAGGKTFTPAQQQEALNNLISSDEYLSSRKGTYAERNGGYFPWLTRVDLSAVQEVYVNVKGKRNTLQFRADILNFGNMLNNAWGVGYSTTSGSFGSASPLTVASVSADGVPTYRMATRVVDGATQLLDKTFVKTISVGNAWQAQLGLRYIFN